MRPVKMTVLPIGDKATLGDHRHYPGARLLLACALCGWQKTYDPRRVIARMVALKTGGAGTPLDQVSRRVAWNCPGCGRVKWRCHFAWPADFDSREAKRMMLQGRG